MDVFYRNSIAAWKSDLQKRQRALMARHSRVEGLHTPEYGSLGKLISLNKYLLEIVSDKLAEAEAK